VASSRTRTGAEPSALLPPLAPTPVAITLQF